MVEAIIATVTQKLMRKPKRGGGGGESAMLLFLYTKPGKGRQASGCGSNNSLLLGVAISWIPSSGDIPSWDFTKELLNQHEITQRKLQSSENISVYDTLPHVKRQVAMCHM